MSPCGRLTGPTERSEWNISLTAAAGTARVNASVRLIKSARGERPLLEIHVKTPDGKVLVEGKTVTGFTDGEEEAVGLTKVVPFLVEDEMMSLGATFSKVKNWGVHTVADGQLITGQNPASSGPAAKLLIDTLNKKTK
jgi:putative intracellular protease/amidase